MKLKEQLGIEYLKDIDKNLRYFCRKIRETLRDERDCVIAVTGYPGTGKSNNASIIGCLIDFDYSFEKNVCFIPTSKQIGEKYMDLPMFSILHIDEASRGLDKKRWYEKIQQKLNELFDTEREGHFLCTLLLMPRFQNFTENFRNFRIKYWINCVERGICVVYRRDEDPHVKDPWHMDENYKLKEKKWKGRRIFDRDLPSIIKIEKYSKNYWFWFQIPKIQEDVWNDYQVLKKDSRIIPIEPEQETYRDKQKRERKERLVKISQMINSGYTRPQIAAALGVSLSMVILYLHELKGYDVALEEDKVTNKLTSSLDVKEDNILINHKKENKNKDIPKEFDKIEEK